MLTEVAKQEIRDKLAAISKAMPGFRSRPAQRLMIAEVAKTLGRSPDAGQEKPATGTAILCVQAGTGTGKSLGYALPGMVMAKQKGKKLIISSSTVALQEQLTTRDIPFFAQAAGMDAKVELAKGRTRYLCHYKLVQAISEMQQVSMFDREDDESAAALNAELQADLKCMAEDFMDGRWNGDRDARESVSDDVWKCITTDRHGCLARNCPMFKGCAQFQARKRIKEADVVVVNHDLLLADLAMGGGKILPSPEESFFLLDEAHSLPEKAVATFASNHLVNVERRSAEKLASIASSLSGVLSASFLSVTERIHEEALLLKDNLGDVFSFFSGLSQLKVSKEIPRPTLEFDQACLPEEFFEIGNNVRKLSNSLVGLLDNCLEGLSDLLATDRSKAAVIEKLMADAGFFRGRLVDVNLTWSLFLEEPADDNSPPVAKWVEASKYKSSVDFRLNASPVVADGYLRSLLWERAAGVVLTSATLTSLGNFDDFLRRTGLGAYNVATLDVPSPFDYASQGTLDIPKMPSPKDYETHTAAVAERLVKDIGQQAQDGMLVLFTSRRQMDDVFSRLPAELQPRILVQGQQSKASIIEAHRAKVDAGSPSVIFGLSSFTEGVDLPGVYCSKVVITKLPFAVPDSPVLRALSGWIERRGGNPFMEISVTDAARKLEQMAGRLIRTESDYGQIVVTDPRLWESRYGRAMLRGLPPFRILAMGRQVAV